jgi:glutaconate CoA-transferase subunit B
MVVMGAATHFEQMFLTGARHIKDGAVLFVGFHWPMVMSRIARRLHAPNIVVVYENGIVEDRLTSVLPTSPCDLMAAEQAAACAGSLEALYMWLGSGRVQMTLVEAAIVDRFGNVNTTAVGHYLKPKVRLPGSGGGTELSSLGRDLLLVSASVNPRSYPERVDYITSPGYLGGRGERTRLGYKQGTGPQTLINPLGIFKFDENGEMYAAGIHVGVAPEDVRSAFPWPIRIEHDHAVLPAPTHDELKVIRAELRHAKERYYLLPQG